MLENEFKFLPAIYIFIWIYTLAHHKLQDFVSGVKLFKVLTLIIIQVRSQFIYAWSHNSSAAYVPHYIFLCTSLSSLLSNLARSKLILTLRLMYFSLFFFFSCFSIIFVKLIYCLLDKKWSSFPLVLWNPI